MTFLPPPHAGNSIRIGDAEREAAISSLADHYAAGRLTKDEYDERVDRVNTARFENDLTPLFADLPAAAPAAKPSSRSGRPRPALLSAPPLWLTPLLTVGVIALVATAVVLTTPWLLLAALWFGCAGFGCGNKNRHYHGRAWARTRQPWQRA